MNAKTVIKLLKETDAWDHIRDNCIEPVYHDDHTIQFVEQVDENYDPDIMGYNLKLIWSVEKDVLGGGW